MAEAEFSNPSGGQWDYGFLIRHSASDQLDVVSVHNLGWWSHDTRGDGYDEYTELDSDRLSNWHDGPLDRNRLLLIVMGDTGWFFVNGRLETALDLRRNMESGDISAMTGFYSESNQDVDFRNFTVWAP